MAADPNAISHIFMTTNTAAFMALAVGHGPQLDLGRQARSRHVGQRLPGRPRGHHRPVRVRHREGLAAHRPAGAGCSSSAP